MTYKVPRKGKHLFLMIDDNHNNESLFEVIVIIVSSDRSLPGGYQLRIYYLFVYFITIDLICMSRLISYLHVKNMKNENLFSYASDQ